MPLERSVLTLKCFMTFSNIFVLPPESWAGVGVGGIYCLGMDPVTLPQSDAHPNGDQEDSILIRSSNILL